MKFEVGKFYRTRDGRKAQIFMLDNGSGLMFGARLDTEVWSPSTWNKNGTWAIGSHEKDLISEWREPIKYSVELWGNEWKPDKLSDITFSQQVHGIGGIWATEKVSRCPIKYRITVEEVPE